MRFLPSRDHGEVRWSLLTSLSYRIILILGLMALFQDGRNFLRYLRCTFGHWRSSDFYFLNSSEQEDWIWGGYNFPSNQFKYGRVIPDSYSTKDLRMALRPEQLSPEADWSPRHSSWRKVCWLYGQFHVCLPCRPLTVVPLAKSHIWSYVIRKSELYIMSYWQRMRSKHNDWCY